MFAVVAVVIVITHKLGKSLGAIHRSSPSLTMGLFDDMLFFFFDKADATY